MGFDIDYDEDGRPVYVRTDDGFAQTGVPYKEEEHGWMLRQIDPKTLHVIRAGREAEALVYEVNDLRRENWELRKRLELLSGGRRY